MHRGLEMALPPHHVCEDHPLVLKNMYLKNWANFLIRPSNWSFHLGDQICVDRTGCHLCCMWAAQRRRWQGGSGVLFAAMHSSTDKKQRASNRRLQVHAKEIKKRIFCRGLFPLRHITPVFTYGKKSKKVQQVKCDFHFIKTIQRNISGRSNIFIERHKKMFRDIWISYQFNIAGGIV